MTTPKCKTCGFWHQCECPVLPYMREYIIRNTAQPTTLDRLISGYFRVEGISYSDQDAVGKMLTFAEVVLNLKQSGKLTSEFGYYGTTTYTRA